MSTHLATPRTAGEDDGWTLVLSKNPKKARKEQDKKEADKRAKAEEMKSMKKFDEFGKFLQLPTEIRQMILRNYLVKPTGIALNLTLRDPDGRYVRRLHYEFESNGISTNRGSSGVGEEVSWTTTATKDQLNKIKKGEWEQPSKDVHEQRKALEAGETLQWANRRGHDRYDILNKRNCKYGGLDGLALFRTSKAVCAEASEIFYGENRFIINTAGAYSGEGSSLRLLAPGAPLIPGLGNGSGTMSRTQEQKFLKMVLEKNEWVSEFIYRNPFCFFVGTIGSGNCAHVKTIMLAGPLKTIRGGYTDPNTGNIGLARTLPYYAALLKHLCSNLRKLTIHIQYRPGQQREYSSLGGWAGSQWDDDLRNRRGLNDNQRICKMIGKLVVALSNLRELRLGEYVLGSKQGTGKVNFMAPVPDREPEESDNEEDSNDATETTVKNSKQKPEEWEGGFSSVDKVRDRERERVKNRGALPLGASLP